MAEIKSTSLNQKAWKRFKRNKSAMFGLGTIVLAAVLAVLAYGIVPDNSPDGDEQVPALQLMPPGTKMYLLKYTRDDFEPTGFLKGMAGGFNKDYNAMPLLNFKYGADSMWLVKYRGKKYMPDTLRLAYADILGHAYDSVPPGGRRVLVDQCRVIERTFWLGTDRFGRDIFSRLIIGIRVSLSVGVIAVCISLLIGIVLGALAGYFRGWVDHVIMWVINVFWSIPTLLLAMGLYISVGNRVENKLVLIFIAVGLTMWVDTARIVRGQFIAVRELEFVTAAKSLGFGSYRIIFKHILPNMWGPVIVIACANFAGAILVESGLSYIGLGIQPPAPSWGNMLNEYKDYIDTDKAYLALFPGIAIMLMVLAFNLVGSGLRDALDVKGQAE